MIKVYLEPSTEYLNIDEFQDAVNELLQKMQSEDNWEIKEVRVIKHEQHNSPVLVACITYDDNL